MAILFLASLDGGRVRVSLVTASDDEHARVIGSLISTGDVAMRVTLDDQHGPPVVRDVPAGAVELYEETNRIVLPPGDPGFSTIIQPLPPPTGRR